MMVLRQNLNKTGSESIPISEGRAPASPKSLCSKCPKLTDTEMSANRRTRPSAENISSRLQKIQINLVSMSDAQRDPGRENLPHLPSREFFNQTIIQYVSMNTKNRRPLLARSEIHETIVRSWQKAGHWLVGRYVIMPDHLHLFCAPYKTPRTPLKDWIEFWRSDVSRNWPHRLEKPIWQKDYFDRQLRHQESYRQKWLYILENPVKAGLVESPDGWPFQGELNPLAWHEP